MMNKALKMNKYIYKKSGFSVTSLFNLTLSALSGALLFSSSVSAADIHIKIAGVNDKDSKIYVQLFNSQDNYAEHSALMATYIKAKPGVNTISFHDLPLGEYSVRFFQDENNNGKLDTNLFGIPAEGYGFSNNAKPNYGAVGYQDVVFKVTEDPASQTNLTEVIY
jgi:uncharacterized protein (DUF2141 family)